MLKHFKIIFFVICIIVMLINGAYSKSPVRLKDIITVEGLKDNQLMGFGLVTGLQGRGDSKTFTMTKKMLLNLASNHGFNIGIEDINGKNVAAVLVTAQTGPFARAGDKVNITISSIGDAKSIEGGVLLQTSLRGADNAIYAVAQGRLIGGKREQNTENTASIPDGAIIERNITSSFITPDNKIRLLLKYPDFVTASQIKEAVLTIADNLIVVSTDPGLIEIALGEDQIKDPINFMAELEQLSVTPDYVSAIVIDKKTGSIVIGEDIIIQECSISTSAARVRINYDRNKKNNLLVKGQTVGELVALLNDSGLETGEIISLLEAIHKIGAINAKLILL